MSAQDGVILHSPDSTGKAVDCSTITQATSGTVAYRQRFVIADDANADFFAKINADGNQAVQFGLTKTPQLTAAVVNISTATTTALVAAVSAKITRVYRVLLTISGTTNLTFKDGATALTGPMPFLAGGMLALDLQAESWFIGSTNTAMNLTTSGAVNVAGTVWYTQI